MMRVVLLLLCAFAALSSSVTERLGIETARILVFSGLVAALVLLPCLERSAVPRLGPSLVALAVLLAAIGVHDSLGRVDPLDYRVVLPLAVLPMGPAIARSLDGEDPAGLVWRLLAFYVLATFAYQSLAEPALVARGYDSVVRYDPTGSVVMHSSLSLICLMLAVEQMRAPAAAPARAFAGLVAAAALFLLLSSASRTTIVALALYAGLDLATGPARRARARFLAGLLAMLAVVFGLYSWLVSDSFLLRLTEAGQGDYSSGRWVSIVHWLSLLAEQPMGLGLGGVRERLAEGRPFLDGTAMLEWPHNEIVRFAVEAGPLGAAFVLVLLGHLVGLAVGAARLAPDRRRRTLLLIIAADIVAECLLQNFLNAVYHATVLTLALTMTAASCERDRATLRPGQAPAPLHSS